MKEKKLKKKRNKMKVGFYINVKFTFFGPLILGENERKDKQNKNEKKDCFYII